MTHPIGVVEIETGRWEGNRLALRTITVQCTPTAKTVTGLHRDFEINGDVLTYSLRMATDGGEPVSHLRAELRRVRAIRAMPGNAIPRSVQRLLTRQSPVSSKSFPLRDRTPDPGLFGPDSVTWVVMREPRLLLAAGRALLMQAANPLVAQGAIEHSTYKSDPYGRLERTVRWVTVVCFGTTREAERVSGRVSSLHRPVSGLLPAANGTSRVPAGTPYSASDPALLRWVHASFVDSMLVAHDALVGGLSTARARHVRARMGCGRPPHGAPRRSVLAGRRGASPIRR